jgi:hypothetical protein
VSEISLRLLAFESSAHLNFRLPFRLAGVKDLFPVWFEHEDPSNGFFFKPDMPFWVFETTAGQSAVKSLAWVFVPFPRCSNSSNAVVG